MSRHPAEFAEPCGSLCVLLQVTMATLCDLSSVS